MAKSTIKANLISGLQRDVITLQEYVETLREQLRDHGGHTAECEISKKSYFVKGWKGGWRRAKCDCGWDEVNKTLSDDYVFHKEEQTG